MRFRSTSESADSLEPTWLAILETFASVGIYVAIAVYFGTTKHIAVAVVLAPLALFRTSRSTGLGLDWFASSGERLFAWQDEVSNNHGVLLDFLSWPALAGALALASWSIRIASTIAGIVRSPLRALAEVPNNWFRQTLCTDSFSPPEAVAGANTDDRFDKDLRFQDLWTALGEACRDDLRKDRGLPEKVVRLLLTVLLFPPFLLALHAGPFVYRVTFKATAIVYAPLIWVFQSTLGHGLATEERLQRIKDGELEKVRRKWSLLALTLLVAKAGVLLGWLAPDHLQKAVPSPEILAVFVVPDSLPSWQVAVGVNAILTIALLWFTDAAMPRLTRERWSGGAISGTVSALTLIRGLLSLYTVAAGFLIAWNQLNIRAYFGS